MHRFSFTLFKENCGSSKTGQLYFDSSVMFAPAERIQKVQACKGAWSEVPKPPLCAYTVPKYPLAAAAHGHVAFSVKEGSS